MSTTQQPDLMIAVSSNAAAEVKKFMAAEGVTPEVGGLRVSVQPGGCSGFKYGLLIEDAPAEDDFVLSQEGVQLFVDPFSAQYLNGVSIDYVSSMQGSGFTFKNPNATGGCGCGSSFNA
ncbi:MAG: iron-sulfur cluster insertion protein ErpA [Gemmatimonadota bacterium]